jgi:hypothetical protein
MRRARRWLVAGLLAAAAITAFILEPFPRDLVLLPITRTHGVEFGDLLVLFYLLGAWIALRRP